MEIKNALVVEDDIDQRDLYGEYLEEIYGTSFRVVTAYDGTDALKKIENQHFDLMISDINMPRMDGKKLIATIRNERLRRPKVVVLA